MELYYIFPVLFLLFAAGNIISSIKGSGTGEMLTKPFLMPLLLLIYVCFSKSPSAAIIAALTCGFLGDVLLMLPQSFFLYGLASFLAGHISYMVFFLFSVDFSKVPPLFYLFVLPYILFAAAMYGKLLPFLKSDKIPVTIYLICITAMSFSSLLRFWSFSGAEFWLPFAGSVFFIASDSILAVGHYKNAGRSNGTAIMATYIIAQAMITAGLIL